MKNKLILSIAATAVVMACMLVSTICYISELETQLEIRESQIEGLVVSNEIIDDFFVKEVDSVSNKITYKLKEKYVDKILDSEAILHDENNNKMTLSQLNAEYNTMFNENNDLQAVLELLENYIDFEYKVEDTDDNKRKITVSCIEYKNVIDQYVDVVANYKKIVEDYEFKLDRANKDIEEYRIKEAALKLIMEETGAIYTVKKINNNNCITIHFKDHNQNARILKSVLNSIEKNFNITYKIEHTDSTAIIELEQNKTK